MGQWYRAVALLGLAWMLAACAATSSAIESQSRAKDARSARMYFMREQGVLGAMGGAVGAEVKVDGKPVGSVTNGSYIFVDRPPGTYKLSVQSGLSMAFETEARVESGGTYYFNIGVPKTGAVGQDLLNQAFAGGQGQQMTGQPFSALMSAAVFYRLDPATGAAEIARLKAP